MPPHIYPTAPAKRGDLVTVTKYSRIAVVGGPGYETESTEIGVVTSVGRDGYMKAFRRCDAQNADLCSRVGAATYRVFPKATTDVEGALAMARAHEWPGGYSARPFGSLAEALTALQPFLKEG